MGKPLPKTVEELTAEVERLVTEADRTKLNIVGIGIGPELGTLVGLCDAKGIIPGKEVGITIDGKLEIPFRVFADIYGPALLCKAATVH